MEMKIKQERSPFGRFTLNKIPFLAPPSQHLLVSSQSAFAGETEEEEKGGEREEQKVGRENTGRERAASSSFSPSLSPVRSAILSAVYSVCVPTFCDDD